jgi:hypothetical protein
MKTIKDTASVKVQQLTKRDVVVVWGGANDIARNNSLVGRKHILEFLINANHTNVILATAPHRHELITNACVNKEGGGGINKLLTYLVLCHYTIIMRL